MTVNAEFKEIAPAVLKFESDIPENSYQKFFNASLYLKENPWINDFTKNTLWEVFNHSDDLDFLMPFQKNILSCLAIYCDQFDEAIHSIQWQEKINIVVNNAGQKEIIFNPSRSELLGKKIDQVPFSRQICVEYFINDNYEGGDMKWKFFNLDSFKPKPGDILVYPGFFLYTKSVKPILKNNRMLLFTSFNGGKDFVAENRSINMGHNDLFFSNMR